MWVKMSVYPLEIVTVLPAELYGIVDGLTTNEASVKESEQSTGLPVTVIESFVKASCEPTGLLIRHWKQNPIVYPRGFVSDADKENGKAAPRTTFS